MIGREIGIAELEAAYKRVSRSLYRAQEDALDFDAPLEREAERAGLRQLPFERQSTTPAEYATLFRPTLHAYWERCRAEKRSEAERIPPLSALDLADLERLFGRR